MNGALDLLVSGDLIVEGRAVPGAVGIAGGRIVYLGRSVDRA